LAQQRRLALYGAITDLDASLASPIGRPTWLGGVKRDLRSVLAALEAHVEEVEGDEGILAQILSDEPWLSDRVDALRSEHPGLLQSAKAIEAQIEVIEPDPSYEEADDLRDAALGLLGALARHRHRGADLVYEAFAVEIGGGG
jgi:hypothetical protein